MVRPSHHWDDHGQLHLLGSHRSDQGVQRAGAAGNEVRAVLVLFGIAAAKYFAVGDAVLIQLVHSKQLFWQKGMAWGRLSNTGQPRSP